MAAPVDAALGHRVTADWYIPKPVINGLFDGSVKELADNEGKEHRVVLRVLLDGRRLHLERKLLTVYQDGRGSWRIKGHTAQMKQQLKGKWKQGFSVTDLRQSSIAKLERVHGTVLHKRLVMHVSDTPCTPGAKAAVTADATCVSMDTGDSMNTTDSELTDTDSSSADAAEPQFRAHSGRDNSKADDEDESGASTQRAQTSFFSFSVRGARKCGVCRPCKNPGWKQACETFRTMNGLPKRGTAKSKGQPRANSKRHTASVNAMARGSDRDGPPSQALVSSALALPSLSEAACGQQDAPWLLSPREEQQQQPSSALALPLSEAACGQQDAPWLLVPREEQPPPAVTLAAAEPPPEVSPPVGEQHVAASAASDMTLAPFVAHAHQQPMMLFMANLAGGWNCTPVAYGHEHRADALPAPTIGPTPAAVDEGALAGATRAMHTWLGVAQGAQDAQHRRAGLLAAVWALASRLLQCVPGPSPYALWRAVTEGITDEQVGELVWTLDLLVDELAGALGQPCRRDTLVQVAHSLRASLGLLQAADAALSAAASSSSSSSPADSMLDAAAAVVEDGRAVACPQRKRSKAAQAVAMLMRCIRTQMGEQGQLTPLLGAGATRALAELSEAKVSLALECGLDMLIAQIRAAGPQQQLAECAAFMRCILGLQAV